MRRGPWGDEVFAVGTRDRRECDACTLSTRDSEQHSAALGQKIGHRMCPFAGLRARQWRGRASPVRDLLKAGGGSNANDSVGAPVVPEIQAGGAACGPEVQNSAAVQ